MVVGVEDPDELTADTGDRGVDVLRLGGGAGDRQQHQPRVAVRDPAEGVLDGQRMRRVVRQHDLQLGGVVEAEERLDRFDDRRGLIGQIRGDDGAGRRVRRSGRLGPGDRVEREEALQDDQQRGQHQPGHHHPVHAGAEVEAQLVRLLVEHERHRDTEQQHQKRGERREGGPDQGPERRAPVAVRRAAHPRCVPDRAQVPVAERFLHGVPGLAGGPVAVRASGQRNPADRRGEADVLVGDDELGAGHGGGELLQAAAGRLLVDAGQQHQQTAVLVPAEPVAEAAEPLRHAGQPFGDLAAYPLPEPGLQGGHLGDTDHGEHAAVPGGPGTL